MKFEFKIEDSWVGVFWKHGYADLDNKKEKLWTDIWICFLPWFPLHITIIYPILIDNPVKIIEH